MFTYYRLRDKIDIITERAKNEGEKRLKRNLEALARKGVAPMPERVCPSTGFSYLTRFFTSSIALELAIASGLNAVAVPVMLDVPKISRKVLAEVRSGEAPIEVTVVALTELMLPDIDALVPSWQEKAVEMTEEVRKHPHYFWANLIVTAPLPFDYYMSPEEYEEEVVKKQGAELFALQKFVFILEEVLDEVLGEGKPVFPERVFELAGLNLPRERVELLKATMMRKMPPKQVLPDILGYLNEIELS